MFSVNVADGGAGGGGGGREGKINAIILKSKAVEADSQMKSNESDRELKQFAGFFANEHRANFAICRAPAQFPVLKGPIHWQRVRAKHTSHFSLFN